MRYLLNDNRFSNLMDRVFDDFEDITFSKQRTMPIEIETKDKEYDVQVELPGVNKEDIDITIDGNKLSVSAKKENTNRDKTHSEFYYGSLSRTITLGEEIDKDNCDAEYKDGILHLTLPKLTVDKTKKLVIK